MNIIDQACNNQLFDDVLFTPHQSSVSRAQTPATRSVHGRPASGQSYNAWSGGARRGLSLGAHTEHRDSRRHTSTPSTRRVINSYSLHVSEIIISPKSKTTRKSATLCQLFCVLFSFTTSRSDHPLSNSRSSAGIHSKVCVCARANPPGFSGFPFRTPFPPFPDALSQCVHRTRCHSLVHIHIYVCGPCVLIARDGFRLTGNLRREFKD